MICYKKLYCQINSQMAFNKLNTKTMNKEIEDNNNINLTQKIDNKKICQFRYG